MPRTCTVCNHEDKEEINKQLITGTSLRNIAKQFRLNSTSLHRHKERHISEELLKSKNAIDSLKADNTFGEYQKAKARIEELNKKTYDLLAKAEAEDDHKACIGYIREARGQESELREQRKLLAELEGKLASQQINVYEQNIINNPEWIELRALIVNTLQPYPAAREAIINALP